jgi:UDP-3-O-[3-hydroxymyristoyl] glucosamine N-acyltransferase
MNITSQELALILNGKLVGDKDVVVNALAKIEDAKKGDLCFLSNAKYIKYAYNTPASVIIIEEDIILRNNISATLIKVKNARKSFAKLINIYNNDNFNNTGIAKEAQIDKSCTIKDDVFIGAFTIINQNTKVDKNVKILGNVFIGKNVTIGENTIIYSGVAIYDNCEIGNNNIIHAGTIIGADGFGFTTEENQNFKIQQIGNVITGNDVEIGANTTIDKASIGSTKIGNGVKLDNLIQIGHNVNIGNETIIAAQTAIGGSTIIGKNCMIGGQTAIAGHLKIANNVKVAGKSGVAADIKEEGKIVQGPLAFDIKEFQRAYIVFKKLPKIYKTINKINKNI